eukprot:gene15338-20669_t
MSLYYFQLLSFPIVVCCSHLFSKNACEAFVNKTTFVALQAWSNISLMDIESSVFDTGIRVQRIEGEWYLSGLNHQSVFSREATTKLILFGLDAQYQKIPNGLDFFIDTSDGNRKSGPVLSYCSLERKSIAIPDYSLLSYPDAGHNITYRALYKQLLRIGMEPKKYNEKAIFCGNMFPRRKTFIKGAEAKYLHVEDTHEKGSKQGKQKNYVTITEICQHQYLLSLPGGISYSSRLKYLLLCNSTVIIMDDYVKTIEGNLTMKYEEWFYPALIPWVHYVPAHNGTHLNDVMEYLLKHPEISAQIANNGAEFASVVLHPTCVLYYWLEILQQYANRMTYRAKVPAAKAILLTNSLIADVRAMEDVRNRCNGGCSQSLWINLWNKLVRKYS